VKGFQLSGNPEVDIKGIEYDSRLVMPGGLFVAVTGFKQDGYDFAAQAVERGAVAIMGERAECSEASAHVSVPDVRRAMATLAASYYGWPGNKMRALGVTGTNGKTTTCYLLKSILEACQEKTGLVTSQVYSTGEESMAAERTTPESLDLQRLLSQMVENGCVNAVIEVSSHALMLHRVDHVDFKIAVYTNLTRDHLDFHKTMEEYLRAKTLLAERIAGESSYVVVNYDVPEFRFLLDRKDVTTISYSVEDRGANVFCEKYSIKASQTVFKLVTPIGKAPVTYGLPGRFNLINAMAAAAAGVAAGVKLECIVQGLETAKPVPGRFNYVGAGQPFAIYIDYAHTPDAIQRLCESARETTGGRLLLLFGCGGDRDKGKRPLMGEAATTHADYAVVTSDNPRGEDPQTIINDIKPGLVGDAYEICVDRSEAIGKILTMARPGDVVLLAGKGDENYQEVAGVRHPFSDTLEALKALAGLGYRS